MTNRKIFLWKGLKFDISDSNVYPPKPASLLLAEKILKLIKPNECLLDACTGSGVVAIATKKYFPKSTVYASDLNPKAVKITKLNAKLNKVKINVVLSDLYNKFNNNYFDIISVHPPAVPYLTHRDWGLSKGMKIATNGGLDGSRIVVRSIVEARRCLKKNGRLLLLLPHWSNIDKSYTALKQNYSSFSILAQKKVEFFPFTEGKPDKEIIKYFYKLARNKIINIEFKNKKPYSTVSVIEAFKK